MYVVAGGVKVRGMVRQREIGILVDNSEWVHVPEYWELRKQHNSTFNECNKAKIALRQSQLIGRTPYLDVCTIASG